MTVQDLLDELQLKYPHSYTNTQVVNRMDRLQKKIFRNLNTYDYFQTVLNAGDTYIAYTGKPRSIRKVEIDEVEYPFWTPEEDKPARYYYLSNDGFLNFSPQASSSGIWIKIWRYQTPTTLSAGSLSASPSLDSDFHMLLVYGVAKEIAEDLRDGSMATAFAVSYNDLYNDMQQSYQNPEVYVVKEIPWG